MSGFVVEDLPTYLLRNILVHPESECWEWVGTYDPEGMPRFTRTLHQQSLIYTTAHNFLYQLFVGPISEGFHPWRKCENKKCVNPSHVSLIKRGLLRVKNRLKRGIPERCGNGHLLTEDNLGAPRTREHGGWICKMCTVAKTDRHRKKQMNSETRKLPTPNPKIQGEKHGNWNGGTYKAERYASMASPEYRAWRLAVYRRDDFTCQDCGIVLSGTKKKMHAHHIKPWSKFPELRYHVSNGVTLCVECHKKAHAVRRGYDR